jgi:hypothetical protein
MTSNFNNDLKFGQTFEILLTNLIQNEGYTSCNNKDYDIAMKENGNTIYYEVKADRMTHKTGNICIEYECFGKPSGITTSKADRYAYFELGPTASSYTLYIIPVNAIKKRISKRKYKRTISGGDYSSSKCYLFDKSVFDKYIFHSE